MDHPAENRTHWTDGVASGTVGMLGFSGTLVATRVAVSEFSPLTVTSSRIVIAGVLGFLFLLCFKKLKVPERRFIPSILVMGLGLAVG
ncbi:MAG: EamA family transporter, partial [Sneathiella sp.]